MENPYQPYRKAEPIIFDSSTVATQIDNKYQLYGLVKALLEMGAPVLPITRADFNKGIDKLYSGGGVGGLLYDGIDIYRVASVDLNKNILSNEEFIQYFKTQLDEYNRVPENETVQPEYCIATKSSISFYTGDKKLIELDRFAVSNALNYMTMYATETPKKFDLVYL